MSHDKKTGTYHVAAAWRERSDWYLNIRKDPHVRVQVGNRQFEARASLMSLQEAGLLLWDYTQRHPTALRELTVVILGRRLPPSRETCQRLAESVPVIALEPVS